MTIIFNLCSFGAAIICFGVGYHLRKGFYRSKIEAFKSYSNAFIFVGLAYIILTSPGLVSFNPISIQIEFILVDTLFLTAVLFFEPATFSLSERTSQFKKITFSIIFWWILIYIFLNIIFFFPAIPLKADGLIYYWKSGTPWLQSLTRGLLCLSALIIAIFFLRRARVSGEKALSKKSILIGSSALIIVIAGSILWFFPFFYFSPKLLILSGALGFSGFAMGAITALLFRPSQESSFSKIT